MPATTATASDLLALIFNGTAIADIAENDTTSPATTITVSLHTNSPGAGGDMTTNEANYTGYLRVTVARTSGGWTVSTNTVSPVSDITFPQATGGTNTITHMGVGSGVGDDLMAWGTVTPNISVSDGVQPVLDTNTVITFATT